MDVLCVGLMVCDIIIKPVGKNVFEVDSTRLDTLKITSGGDSLNAAINMAKLGIRVGLVGKVGNDVFGEFLINEAQKQGVITEGIIKTDEYCHFNQYCAGGQVRRKAFCILWQSK